MRVLKTLLLPLLMSVAATSYADNYEGTLDVFESASELKPYFENAYGYAVFPVVGKGGVVIGGAGGKGRVYEQGTAVGNVTMAKLTLGFQFGGQAFSEIIFLQDKRAFDEFTSGRFEFDATASAVVITLGAQAQAGTKGASASTGTGPASTNQLEYGYNKGMAVFVHPLGGLMYEASVGGQRFDYKPFTTE